MPTTKKTTARRRAKAATTRAKAARTRARTSGREAGQAAAASLRHTWTAAVEAVTGAEAEAQRQLRRLLTRNRLRPEDARVALAGFRTRVEKERKRAARELDARLGAVQTRLRRERRSLGRAVEDAVRGTLASLNIPSRREVTELTHKVDELSRKIDGFRRPRRTRSGRRPAAASASAS